MMPISNNLTTTLVSNLATAMKAAGTTVKSYADLSDGQLALLNPNNLTLDPATAISTYTTYPVRFVVRNGTNLVFSDWIHYNASNVHVQKTYVADTQQVSYVGYNGTSGAMDVFDLNEYILNIEIKDEDVATAVYPYMKHGAYYSTSNATQADVALGLVASLQANFKREHLAKVKFEAVCNTAVNAAYDLTNTSTIVNGSKTFAVANDLTYNTAAGTLAVGDYIRIADDSLNGTLALTDPVYKVVAINTLNVTVDRPIDVPSGSWTDAGDGIQVITAAQAAAADWGIRMTAVARTNFVPGVQKHYLTTFKVFLARGFESTEVTYTTAAAYGIGTYQEVAEMEYISQGNAGKKVTIGVPPFVSRSAASAAVSYTRNTYTFKTDGYEGMISNNPDNLKVLYIYTGRGGQADIDVAAIL